jgi:hypothetical protein
VPVNHEPQHFVRRPDRKRCAVLIHRALNPESAAGFVVRPGRAQLCNAGYADQDGDERSKGVEVGLDLVVDLDNGRWVGKGGGELTR